MSALAMQFFIFSLETTSVAHVAVIYAVVPFLAAGLGWLMLREIPSRTAILASLAALCGVLVMVGLGSDGRLIGDILAFGMTLCMALLMIIARKWPSIPALQAACASAVLSSLAVMPFADAFAPAGSEWLTLAAFGLVNSAIGLALFAIGSRLLPPIETALIGALDAPLAPLWVWLVFGDTPSLPTLVGGLIVFAAVVAHIVLSAAPARE
jgi:drug/metabolite transporter (DMT)-like permease